MRAVLNVADKIFNRCERVLVVQFGSTISDIKEYGESVFRFLFALSEDDDSFAKSR